MRKIRKLYPGGKEKAFNISYDDGILQDVRFVRLLRHIFRQTVYCRPKTSLSSRSTTPGLS